MQKMMNAFFLGSLLLLASCSAKTDNTGNDQLAQKKAQLEELKNQQKSSPKILHRLKQKFKNLILLQGKRKPNWFPLLQ